MKALLDSDLFVYRVGYTTNDVDIGIATWRMDDLINKILAKTKATGYTCYLTASNDSTSYRKHLLPEYKGNRKQPKPIHYAALREHLVTKWNATIVSCIEADDALGIDQTGDTVIVSIDKDLDMIPGNHYNFVKDIHYPVLPEDAIRNFYMQCLVGDVADNIKCIKGIGPKKAEKLLQYCETEEELFNVVREVWDNDEEFLIKGECLWILKEPFPQGRWRFTPLGSQLLPEVSSQLELAFSPEVHATAGFPSAF